MTIEIMEEYRYFNSFGSGIMIISYHTFNMQDPEPGHELVACRRATHPHADPLPLRNRLSGSGDRGLAT